jgi:hypothetical protein
MTKPIAFCKLKIIEELFKMSQAVPKRTDALDGRNARYLQRSQGAFVGGPIQLYHQLLVLH